ncbi:hypothetical protein Pcinc_033606, partial [Petrolisthes cinctipes]
QRIHTVEVGNSRYFVSNASPYSPQLNWFLAYQYCRTIGMELLTLETQEEVLALNTFLSDNNNGRSEYWTSGNQLGSAMWIWMSTGQPYNTTFHYWPASGPPLTKTQQSCMSKGSQTWTAENCMDSKAFICEQTRCFYYNYVTSNRQTSNQGNTTNTSGVSRFQSSSRTSPIPLPLTRNRPQQQQQQNSGLVKIMPTTTTTPSSSSPLKIMPTTSSPLKIMPLTSPAPLTTMPTTQALKIMPTISSPPTKIMPTVFTPTAKIMPTTTETMLKSMPATLKPMPAPAPPPGTTQSASSHNNEIVPISPLALMQPPLHEFVPSPLTATEPPNSTLTQQHSRKETFSWALLDSDTKK